MTPLEYRAALLNLGLNFPQAAEFLGVSYRTAKRMAEIPKPPKPSRKAKKAKLPPERTIPQTVAMVINMTIRYKLRPNAVVEEFA